MSIKVDHVSKRYLLQQSKAQTFQQAMGQMFGLLKQGKPFWALREVSFEVGQGEAVGIIGHNGAGKSTLLRLICGLGRPTRGKVQTQGRVAALLELGAGFHPHLTGRENLYVSAVVSGLRQAEVKERFQEIVDFAEIEEFIDQPLRTYSSGMQLRLGFAVAVHVDPDVLIVDEALAVGDGRFQQKCLERIESFQKRGKTLLIVSHDMNTINRFCNRAIWLEHGYVKADGPAWKITEEYLAYINSSPSLEGQVVV